MDRLAAMEAFVQVVERHGFTAAAEQLRLSRAMVSKHVQDLEERLGARLLNRSTRSVSLTEIGHEYYERCLQIRHEVEEADQMASALQRTPRGQLRIYCHTGLGRFMAPLITEFLARYAEVSVDLRTGDALMIDLVQDGYDLGITPGSPPDATLVRRRLSGWRYVLCCAPAYLERNPEPKSPVDLKDHNCILYAYSLLGNEWPFRDSHGNTIVARPSGNLVTTSFETIRAVAVAGGGLFLTPPYHVCDHLGSGALVPLMRDYNAPDSEIAAVYPHRRHLAAKVRTFVDLLANRFAKEHAALMPALAGFGASESPAELELGLPSRAESNGHPQREGG
ncbi:MAG: LysR family transcriptional regulator [Acetobacteraceae bacterium]